jgi:hypothetical protein
MKRLLIGIVIFIFWTQGFCAQAPLRITFGSVEAGKFPVGWVSRDLKTATKVYSVQVEGGKTFLHADAQDASAQISLEARWDLRDYPILRWDWRSLLFPTGSDEQVKSGADSVLAVYVVFRGLPFVRAIKYIWSDTLPTGAAFDSPYSGGTKIVVVRSGRALAGTWVGEERDVLSDYERFFGKDEKRPAAQGIALLTDSDDTHSRAIGDYADIRIAGPR